MPRPFSTRQARTTMLRLRWQALLASISRETGSVLASVSIKALLTVAVQHLVQPRRACSKAWPDCGRGKHNPDSGNFRRFSLDSEIAVSYTYTLTRFPTLRQSRMSRQAAQGCEKRIFETILSIACSHRAKHVLNVQWGMTYVGRWATKFFSEYSQVGA
jgi:hypothetical protein